MLKEEVERGWQLPLPREAALESRGCEVAPLGMVAQTSIDEKGNPIDKLRLTHDQSFNPSGTPGRSVNDRVDTSQLTIARFGKAFSRLLYHISYLRQLWPDDPILLTKVDCKSTYRRIHLKANTAVKSCTSIDDLLLVALRMTFGGAPNPSQWSDVSEVITDLANDLVRRSDWDPEAFHSPHQHLLDSDEAVDNDEGAVDPAGAFGKADFLAVNYPTANHDDLPRFDCYLDDIFGAFNPKDAARSAAAIPLALHIVGRPVDTGSPESFPRDDIPRHTEVPRGSEALRAENDPRLGGRHETVHSRPDTGQTQSVGSVHRPDTGKRARPCDSEGLRDDARTTQPCRLRHPLPPTFHRKIVQGVQSVETAREDETV